jgi:hypothetical protein
LTIAIALVALPAAPAAGRAQPAERPAGEGDACRAGLAHERAGALPRAFVELTRCTAHPPAAPDAAAALARVKKKLAAGDYAPVSFSLRPPGAAVRIAPFTDSAPLADPYELWLPFGRHTYVASAPGHTEMRGEIVVDSTARMLVQVELDAVSRTAPSRSVDFADEGPSVGEPIVVADPKPKKMPSLIPERFRRGLGPDAGGGRSAAPAGASAAPTRPRARQPTHRWPWILTWGL